MTFLSAVHTRLPILLAAILALALGADGVVAQTDVAPEQRDLPPVASPTNKVLVAPIPVVRSESEAAGDFGTGLMQGLIASGKVREAALIAVKDGHVMVAKGFGPDYAEGGGGLPSDLMHFAPPRPNDVALSLEDEGSALLMLVDSAAEEVLRLHPVEQGLPVRTGRFFMIRRNGWRALTRDAEDGPLQSRLVIVPEAKLAYLIILAGKPGAPLWRKTDDAFFDALLAARDDLYGTSSTGRAPSFRDAEAAAGIYEAQPDDIAFLKMAGERLRATARADGALIVSGSESATLLPQATGYWSADNGNLNAVLSGGGLLLSTGLYRPLAFWKRPVLYVALALLAALLTVAAAVHARRTARAIPNDLVLGGGGLASALLVLAALVWFLSPAV